MTERVTITVPPEMESDGTLIKTLIESELRKRGSAVSLDGAKLIREKKSVDARHGKIKLVLRYQVLSQSGTESSPSVPEWRTVSNASERVIIVGSGPAGLFGALTLLEHGIKPIIVERGSDVHKRKRDIAGISTGGTVQGDSNYCFGEGGAGTFSDGKLYTRSNKRGDIPQVLRLFNHFGADSAILSDAHPHIGTDRLPAIVEAMRNLICQKGGEFLFDTRCTDFLLQESPGGRPFVTGIRTLRTKDGAQSELHARAVMLCTGHSASDIYELVARRAPDALEAKTFAVGVRVEHPRKTIDRIQYHGTEHAQTLGAAEYRFTSQQEGRGTYSFCMCPGGFIVPSATGPGQIVVNGMSAAGRNSAWSNAAFVVETRPEDIPENFLLAAKERGTPALAGLLWRESLEREAFLHGDGQAAPAQRLTDFLSRKGSSSLPPASYAPGVVSSRLDEWLPQQISSRLMPAFRDADKRMHGFVTGEALLVAIETRTSTPVRILRDARTGECTVIQGLYPAGEGSGYSGGIVSSAMDGMKCCASIAASLGGQ